MPDDPQAELAKLAAEAVDTVEANLVAIEELQKEAAASKVACEKLQADLKVLQDQSKQASTPTFQVSEQSAQQIGDEMVRLGFIRPQEKVAAVEKIQQEPERLVNLAIKLAANISAPLIASDGSPCTDAAQKFAGKKPSTTRWW